MNKTAAEAIRRIRDFISEESRHLPRKEYALLLEELLSEAEGWKMEKEEAEDDEDD